MNTSKHILIESYSSYQNGSPIGNPLSLRYMESKFERQVGDSITFEGTKYIVTYVGSDKNDVVDIKNDRLEFFKSRGMKFTNVKTKF